MAVPKKRVSKQRQRKRRTHYKATPPTLIPCPQCGDPHPPHRVCPTCGTYRHAQRVETDLT